MPRPEEVSHDHIDSTVVGFLKGEKDLNWTEVSLATLHPREEIRLVPRSGRPAENTRCLPASSLLAAGRALGILSGLRVIPSAH